jgi:hypothetical protein
MFLLSDEAISELVNETKSIPEGLRPLSRLVERNKHQRRDYEIICDSGNCFVIAVRQSTMNVFDFSALLCYRMPGMNKLFRLRRYNGRSHFHTNTLEKQTFRDFHIHMATERYQNICPKEDHFAVVDKRYSDLNSAVDCLLYDCGFRNPIEESPIFTGQPIS